MVLPRESLRLQDHQLQRPHLLGHDPGVVKEAAVTVTGQSQVVYCLSSIEAVGCVLSLTHSDVYHIRHTLRNGNELKQLMSHECRLVIQTRVEGQDMDVDVGARIGARQEYLSA